MLAQVSVSSSSRNARSSSGDITIWARRDMLSSSILTGEPRGDCGHGFGRRHHGHDLEVDQVLPAGRPPREKLRVLAFHDLEASPEVVGHPARHVAEPFGRKPALVTKPPVYRRCIPVAKVLDDHVQHEAPPRM